MSDRDHAPPANRRRDPSAARRLGALALGAALLALGLSAMLADAASRLRAQEPGALERQRLARAVGLSDLALSSDARWLRHPSAAEPGAALADAPAALDVDPAGAWIAPPRAVLGAGAGRIGRR